MKNKYKKSIFKKGYIIKSIIIILSFIIGYSLLNFNKELSYEELIEIVNEADGERLSKMNIINYEITGISSNEKYDYHWDLPDGEYYNLDVVFVNNGGQEMSIPYLIDKNTKRVLYCSVGGLFFAEYKDGKQVEIYEYENK